MYDDGDSEREAPEYGQEDASDTLAGDPGDDPLDEGIIPPDRWSPAEKYGATAQEQAAGESLDQLLAEEQPEPDPYEIAGRELGEDAGDAPDATAAGGYSPDRRAGRLVGEDEGAHPDAEPDLVAWDAGIDAGAASAEEAAVHELGTGSEDTGDEDPEPGGRGG